MPFAEDQHPVGDLRPRCEHEPFRISIRARTPRRDLHGLDAGIGQHRIERAGELPSPAIMGYDADRALLHDAGVELDVLDAGCCGLAGNFGFEAGHYDVSRACGERVLLPAVRDAAADTMVLADGFSCRTQIEQAGTGRTPVHLAEILAAGLRGEPARPSRPTPPRPADYARLTGIAAAGAGAVAALAARRRKG